MMGRDKARRAFRYNSLAAFVAGWGVGELGVHLFKDEILAATLPHPEWVDELIPVSTGLLSVLIYLHTWTGEYLSGIGPRRKK